MHIKADGLIEKAQKLSDGEVEFVVSTNALDSHGERIDVNGIDIKEYKNNPVVLWGHDGFNLPIAKATKIWKEGGKLMARAKFYLKDPFAHKVYDYIVDGYLNAVSIGGMVEEWASDGITISKMNMKEFSVVSIPANPEALATAKSLDGNQKAELRALANGYARKMLEKADGSNEIQRNIDTLETLVATLREVAVGETQKVQADQITRRVVLKQAQVVVQQAETVIRSIKLKEINNE
jgi:HK97 family phage prohead protease